MSTLAMLAMFAGAAFLVAWVTNGLVGRLSGERPGQTGRLWLDTFVRVFAVLELGWLGRILNYAGLRGLPRKLVLFLGLLCVLLFLVRGCQRDHQNDSRHIRSYPVQAPSSDQRLTSGLQATPGSRLGWVTPPKRFFSLSPSDGERAEVRNQRPARPPRYRLRPNGTGPIPFPTDPKR
jgi:hypothetical protein